MPVRPDALLTTSDRIRLDRIIDVLVPGVQEGPEEHAFRDLSTSVPLVLLPVRLEARFAATGHVLKVRVYPDDVHQDGLQRSLTELEITAGRAFWSRLVDADDTMRCRAWSDLAAACGPGPKGLQRAHWVARQTAEGSDPGAPRDPAQSEPLTARALPTRWLALAFAGGREVGRAWGADIRTPLVLGPDVTSGTLDPDRLFSDDATSWLVDYPKAAAAGMAIDLPLPPGILALDLLLVVGVGAGDPAAAQAELESLLEAHRYRWGIGLLGSATPTNVTTTSTPDWSSVPDVSAGPSADPAADGSDLSAVRTAFGLPASQVLSGITGGDLHEQQLQSDMNSALWATTWGEFLETLLDDQNGDDAVARPLVRAVRSLFIDAVRAGGPLPVLRTGRQPYGLLPATSLTRWKSSPSDAPELLTVASVLTRLRPFWVDVARSSPRVVPADRVAGDQPDTTVASILAQGPWPDPGATGHALFSGRPSAAPRASSSEACLAGAGPSAPGSGSRTSR